MTDEPLRRLTNKIVQYNRIGNTNWVYDFVYCFTTDYDQRRTTILENRQLLHQPKQRPPNYTTHDI